jgi:hypothetical protein
MILKISNNVIFRVNTQQGAILRNFIKKNKKKLRHLLRIKMKIKIDAQCEKLFQLNKSGKIFTKDALNF